MATKKSAAPSPAARSSPPSQPVQVHAIVPWEKELADALPNRQPWRPPRQRSIL